MVNLGRIGQSQTVIINDHCQYRNTLHYDKATIVVYHTALTYLL